MKKSILISVSLALIFAVGILFYLIISKTPGEASTQNSEHKEPTVQASETPTTPAYVPTENLTTPIEDVTQTDGTTIESLFTYRNCLNPEIAEQDGFDESMLVYEVPKGSAEYIKQLQAYCREYNIEQTENGLCFTLERVLAVDGLFALQWTVKNISDDVRILNATWLSVNGEFVGGKGNVPNETAIDCGETLRFTTATAIPEFDKVQANLQISIDICDKGGNETGHTLLELMSECAFTPIMGISDDETIEIPWQNGTLCISEAKQNLGMGIYTVLFIFDSEEQALMNDPCGDETSWYPGLFCDDALTDEDWIAVGGGDISDNPIELPDGRWAFSFSRTVDFINWIPKTVYVSPCPNWTEADKDTVIKIVFDSDLTN